MSQSGYIKIMLKNVPAQLEDIITGVCFDHGCSGVSEALNFNQSDLMYEPSILNSHSHTMEVYFDKKPEREFFEELKKYDSRIDWTSSEEENKDWLAEWKKGFVPFQLVGPHWIVPSWLEVPADCSQPLFIDPGMAFGTGTHATTKMAAYFVHKLCTQYSHKVNQWKLLDVGTGTAILAMLARKSGVSEVVGIEIDPEARRVAKENILLNKLDAIQVPDSLIEDIRESYDVVVANIIDGVLIQIQSDLLRVLKPGGFIFLTGILTERDNIFFEKFIEKNDLKVIRRLEKDEWVGYWCQSPETL